MANKVRLSWKNLTAGKFADLFVDQSHQINMRVGHRGGGTQGTGIIPFNTGALQSSIRVIATGAKEATVVIGGGDVHYAEYLEFCELQPSGHLNLHKGYVEEFILGFYKAKIAQQLKTNVTATIERGQQ